MAIPLYMDVHVPRAITLGLRLRGVDIFTAQEDGRHSAIDPVLLDRAGELARALFTQDDDLPAEAHRRQKEGIPFHGVIYAHQLRVSIGKCVQDLEIIAQASDPADLMNRVQFLPL